MKGINFKHTVNRALTAAMCAGVMLLGSGQGSYALSTSYYTAQSLLASGKWVKVKTTGEGVHRISYDELRTWGFNDPSKVNVYGYGATLLASDRFSEANPDDIKPTATVHADNSLFFYSTGVVKTSMKSATDISTQRNYYSNEVFYLLSDRPVAASEIAGEVTHSPSPVAYDAHLSILYNEEELFNPTHGGAYYLGREIPEGGSLELPFTVVNAGSGNSPYTSSKFTFQFAATRSNGSTSLTVEQPATIPGAVERKNTAAASGENVNYQLGSTLLTMSTPLADATHVFRALHPNSGQTYVAADYASLVYPRLNKMQSDPQLILHYYNISSTSNFVIEAPASTKVFNITSPDKVCLHATSYDADNGTVSGTFGTTSVNGACDLVAFDTAKPQAPVEFAGHVANQNMHGIATPDMLIITTADLYDSAQGLAQIHRDYDGMDVEVVRHDLLFNEFSSATPDAMAYRRFIKMLYDRNPSKFKYVIMYGPSHYDNRSINVEKKDRLMLYQTPDVAYSSVTTKAFGTDSYFGFLADGYKPDDILKARQYVAVGRIPVSDNVTAAQVNRKIETHVKTLPSTTMFNTALIMADDGDKNEHLTYADELAAMLEDNHKALTVVRAYCSIYPLENYDAKMLRNLATKAFSRGVGFYAYVGHGHQDAFGAENIWNRFAAKNTSYDLFPFAMLATCDPFTFDTGRDNIGQEMLFKEDGGVICLVAANRTVYGLRNQDLARKIAAYYTNATEGTTMGQIWLDARNDIHESSAYLTATKINTLCYNFGGDPALRLAVPTYNVEITSFEGSEPGSANIEPLQPCRIEGRVVNAAGNTVDDFNGTLTLQLYESAYTVPIITEGRSDAVAGNITLTQDLLSAKTVDITNGRFSTTLTAPVPVHEGSVNRLTLHADADDGRRGDGYFDNLSVLASNTSQGSASAQMPVIESMSVSQLGFESDLLDVSMPVRIVANGTVDEIGLNSSSAIGAGSMLIIDGKTRIEGIAEALRTNPSDNTWSLALNVNVADAGNHTAELIIADNAGQRTSHIVPFTLNTDNAIEMEVDNAVTDNAITFDAQFDLGTLKSSCFSIHDRMGATVYTRTNPTFPLTVELDGQNLSRGHYTAVLQASGSNGNASSAHVPFVYLKD